MTKLKNIYDTIQNSLAELSEFDTFSAYQDNVNCLENAINDLYKYYGIRTLKRNVGSFRKDEVVQILQDVEGCWITALDDDEDPRQEDLFEYMILLEEAFYD